MWEYIKENRRLIALGAIIHLVAVFFTEGYHRPDEHLAMIHMMQYKLDTFPKELLSWEYPVQIRPWLQPALQFIIVKVLFFVENPFVLAFFFRLFASITSFISLLMISYWGTLYYSSRKQIQKYILPLAMGISYFPFFHARATGENFGMTFYIFGLFLLLRKIPNKYFQVSKWRSIEYQESALSLIGSGFLLGLSFYFRFQMGIAVFFLLIWLLSFSKISLYRWSLVCLGILFSFAVNTLIDFWGYGVWTFSPWNYLYQNIALNKAAGFGVSPWYYYLTKTFSKSIPPLGLVFILPFFWVWFKRPKSLFTWITLPFFIIHGLIGHKELRFIFGLGSFLPLLLPAFLDEIQFSKWKGNRWVKILLTIILIENFGFMAISSLRPAFSPIKFYKHVYQITPPITEMYTLGVFRDQLRFYLKKPIHWTNIKSTEEIQALILEKKNIWILTSKYKDIKVIKDISNCQESYLSYPNWIFKFNYGNWLKRSKIWGLYQCQQ
jgi:GPI mannosyltransferase 3